MTSPAMYAHERRVTRRLEARGEPGLGEALTALRGCVGGGRYRLDSLYAVGSEGAVFLATDLLRPDGPRLCAKIGLSPLHRPFDLSEDELVHRRNAIREEAWHLERSASEFMPRSLGLHEFSNPHLDAGWGGAFGEPEPMLVMERLPGFDLDLWLARMHRSPVPKHLLRRQLDHVAVVVLTALLDLQEKGYYYTDLRPGNVRIRGRSRNRVRMLDAGSLVLMSDDGGTFPHVPAYLPTETFHRAAAGHPVRPSRDIQAVMAGRTLFEVATGRVPVAGESVDTSLLKGENVSPSVADTIDGLCSGDFPDVTQALRYLSKRSEKDPAAVAVAVAVRTVQADSAVPRPPVPAPAAPAPAAEVVASRPEPAQPALVAVAAVPAAPAPSAPSAASAPAHVASPAAAPRRTQVQDLESVLARARAATPVRPAAPPPPPAPAEPREPERPRLSAHAVPVEPPIALAVERPPIPEEEILPPSRPSLWRRLLALLVPR